MHQIDLQASKSRSQCIQQERCQRFKGFENTDTQEIFRNFTNETIKRKRTGKLYLTYCHGRGLLSRTNIP